MAKLVKVKAAAKAAENHNEFTRFAFLYDLVKPKAVYLTVAKKVQ